MVDERLRHLMNLAREHYEHQEYDRAEPLLREIVRHRGSFADMHNMLGVILHQHGHFSDAEKQFELALAVNPAYTEAALNLAVTYNDLGKYKEAREVYSSATARSRLEGAGDQPLDPFARGKIANMHARIGDAYVAVGLYDDAVREFRRALELCPTFVDIRTKLGSTLRDKGEKEAAIAEYQAVKETQPAYLPARIHLGVTLFALGRKDEARAEWEAVLHADPANKSCKMYLDMLQA
jgi:tetratricopeptide (TPR) repeat protein